MVRPGRKATTTELGPSPARGFTTGRAVVLLVAVVLAAFAPVRENGFVNYDDRKNFLENPYFRGLGRAQLAWAWTAGHLGVYEPLGWMLLEAEYAAWGLDPRGYHLASLAAYVLAVVVLYGLTVALVARGKPGLWRDDPAAVRAGACLAVGLFAAHPLRVEAVAWASCQSYVVCALFSGLTVLAYVRAHDAPPRVRRGWQAGAFLLFAASLLSKAAAMGLPAVLLILDVYPLRRLGPGRWWGPRARRVYAEKVPFVALSAVFLGLAVWARAPSLGAVAGHTAEARVARACYGVGFYLVKTAAPVRVSACYPVPFRMSLAEPRFLLSAAGVLAATAALGLLRRKWPGALAAWAAYLVLLAPNSGLVQKGGQYVAADRYCLIPMMALVVLAASALAPLLQRGRFPSVVARGVLAAGVVAGLVLVVRTREQCRTWHDSVALWSHALAASTEPNPFASYNLGLALAADPRRLPEAERLIAQAVQSVPNDPAPRNALTTVVARQGRLDEALANAREALRLAPDNVNARVNLGNVLALKRDPIGAAASFESALRLDPGNADAHANLGLLRLAQGRRAEAAEHLTEALRLNPSLRQARGALDELQRRQGR